MTCLNKDKDLLAFMLFKFPGSVKSACVQETIFVLNFSNLKRKAPNVIFNLAIYFTNTVVYINFVLMMMMMMMMNFFVVWLTDKRQFALFPAGTIVIDPHHRESLTCHKQGLNLRRT